MILVYLQNKLLDKLPSSSSLREIISILKLVHPLISFWQEDEWSHPVIVPVISWSCCILFFFLSILLHLLELAKIVYSFVVSCKITFPSFKNPSPMFRRRESNRPEKSFISSLIMMRVIIILLLLFLTSSWIDYNRKMQRLFSEQIKGQEYWLFSSHKHQILFSLVYSYYSSKIPMSSI